MKAKKFHLNPIIKPNPMSIWESKYVFNPGVIYDKGVFHMLYRAQGADMVSRLGYAVSIDGVNFNRMSHPVLEPTEMDEVYGLEDPRIVKFGHEFYIFYTVFSPLGIAVKVAKTENFIHYFDKQTILTNYRKDPTLFPEKIGKNYFLLCSENDKIVILKGTEFKELKASKVLALPSESGWDSVHIGPSAPPIKTEYGWLLLYYGVETVIKPIFRLGMMLLDLKDPSKVIKRSREAILEPSLSWEISGGVPHAIFACSMIQKDEKFHIYYGGADSAIGVATLEEKVVYDWIKES